MSASGAGAVPPGLIPSTIGANLIAAIVETYFLGILTFQYAKYYTSGFKDPLWITIPTAFLYVLNMFHCITIIYMVWYYAIQHFGDYTKLGEPKLWPFCLSAILTSFSAFVTKLFLIYRAYRLSRNNIIPIPLLLVTVGALVCGIMLGVRVWLLPSLDQLITVQPTFNAYLSLEVAGDWLIAGVLIWVLRTKSSAFQHSRRILRRLFQTAVQVGLVTSLFATMTIILFFAYPNTEYTLITGVPIGALYTATLMDTLLSRKVLREMIGNVQLHPDVESSAVTASKSLNPGTSFQLQVRQEQETIIHFEESDRKRPSGAAHSDENEVYIPAKAL